jgi:ferredoxin
MRVTIDKQRCAGTGLCAEICPDVFGVNSDYTVFLKRDGVEVQDGEAVVPSAELTKLVEEAAESCPTDTILLDSR